MAGHGLPRRRRCAAAGSAVPLTVAWQRLTAAQQAATRRGRRGLPRLAPSVRGMRPMAMAQWRHPGYTPRRGAGLTGYERVLARAGLPRWPGSTRPAAAPAPGRWWWPRSMLNPAGLSELTGMADSKALTPGRPRGRLRAGHARALAWHVVVIPSADIDRLGCTCATSTGMRRALAGLARRPGYVLTDGFPVRGLAVPALAMWKGDEVAACVAAASIVAKVTRDRIMTELHEELPRLRIRPA